MQSKRSGPLHFMAFSVAQVHECRQISLSIKTKMEFDRPFSLSELCPGEDSQKQVYSGGVE
jgi:hypothetical protein